MSPIVNILLPLINGTQYSRMEQVKFVEDNFTCSVPEYFSLNITLSWTVCQVVFVTINIQVALENLERIPVRS